MLNHSQRTPSFSKLIPIALSILLALSFSAHAEAPVFVSVDWAKKYQSELIFIDLSAQLSYIKFHIPNALWVNYKWLIKPTKGINLSRGPVHIAKVLSQLGISPNSKIIIYDDMGNLDSSRLYWELKKLNHKNVSLLDGGIISWILAGNKVTQKRPKRPKKTNYLVVPRNNLTDALTAYKADVLDAIKDPKTLLIDARTQSEYEGDPKQPRSGHIPTAILFNWARSFDTLNGYKQVERTLLLGYLKTLGIDKKDQPIIIYCTSAHRAARVVSMLQSLEFSQVKLYDASMQEYVPDLSLKLTLGAKP